MRSDETKTVSQQANEKQTCTPTWKEKHYILSDLLHQCHSNMHIMVTIMQHTTAYTYAYKKVYELSKEFDTLFDKLKEAITEACETEYSVCFSDSNLMAKRIEALDKMLHWEGIFGYTNKIWDLCCAITAEEAENEIRYYEEQAK